MLRSGWTGFSSFIFASLIAQANFETPLSTGRQLPETASLLTVEAVGNDFDEPFCYIQATDGRVIDLTNLCGQTPTLSVFSYPRPPQAYNTGAIRAFDASVYGEGN